MRLCSFASSLCGAYGGADQHRYQGHRGSHGAAGELSRLPVAEAAEASEEFAAECAAVLRCILSVLDPGAVVLAGRFSDRSGDFPGLLERSLGSFECRIVTAKFGEFSAARGAALQTHCSI